MDFFLIFFITLLPGHEWQYTFWNIKSNILVRQLLNLVIFHLPLNKPYLLLLFFFLFLLIFLRLLDNFNGYYWRSPMLDQFTVVPLFWGSDYWWSFLAGLSGDLTPARLGLSQGVTVGRDALVSQRRERINLAAVQPEVLQLLQTCLR